MVITRCRTSQTPMSTMQLRFGILLLLALGDIVMATSFTTCGRGVEGYGQISKDASTCITKDFLGKIMHAAKSGNLQESLNTVVKPMCRNVECELECFNNVVGGCSKYPWYFIYDMDQTKINLRVMCDLIRTREDVFESCLPMVLTVATQCAKQVTTDIHEAARDLAFADIGAYKSEMCKYFETLRNCLTVEPTATCSEESASLLTQMYTAMYSYPECGLTPDTNFTRPFLGETRCDKSQDTKKYCYMYKCDPSRETCLILEDAILLKQTRMCIMGFHGCYTQRMSDHYVEAGCSPDPCQSSSEKTCCHEDQCNSGTLNSHYPAGKPVVSLTICDDQGQTYAAGTVFKKGCERCLCRYDGQVTCVDDDCASSSVAGTVSHGIGKGPMAVLTVVLVGLVAGLYE